MPLDDDADDDVGSAGPPLPPDDRLWRHPSELREHGLAGGAVRAAPSDPRSFTWTTAIVAGLVGAVLSTSVIALTGALSPRTIEQVVVEKVAVTPVVSSPMIRGERGVVAVAERLSPAIVRMNVTTDDDVVHTGSGVLYRSNGLLLTSAHVVTGAETIDVELTDGRHFQGRLLGADPLTDIALVQIDGRDLPVAVLGTAEGLEVGAPTVAIGSPLGFEGGPSVTTGIISAVARRIEAEGGVVLHGMIQTDAPIAPGSSGGALVDSHGSVIGVTTAVASEPSGRFGFATPIDIARRVADHLLADGRMVHSWIGIEGTDVASEDLEDLGVEGGARVREVVPGSPADAAGLQPGDVITSVDGQPLSTISDLVVVLRQHDPGRQVAVDYVRDGEPGSATVTLAARPDAVVP